MTARTAFQQVPALYLIQNQALYRKEKKAMMKQAGKIAALCLSLLLLLPTAASAEEGDVFSKSDYNNVAEEAEDAVITLEGDHGTLSDETRGRSGNPVVIERKGVYRVTGRSDGVTIRIKEPKKSGNIYLILDHASMTNQKGPCIEAEAAEKVILQCVGENSLVSMSDSGAPLYSEDDLTVNGPGRLHIESGKNGIHCKSALRITGATISIRAANDGLKGKQGIYVDGGSVTIDESYEGMEGACVLIRSGELRVTASDDGINAAGENEIQGDVIIEGGSLYLNAAGDAIDSNRSILISGGVTLVEGPENSRNSIFDKGDGSDAQLSISGGTVLAIGSIEKAKNFKSGTQYSRLEPISGQAGDVIGTDDGSGIALTATKSFSCVIYSSPSFTGESRIQVSAPTGEENPDRRGWDSTGPTELTEEIRTLFRGAAGTLVGVDYEPVAVLGRRGEETFCLLCRATAAGAGEPYYLLMELTAGDGTPILRALREVRLDRN